MFSMKDFKFFNKQPKVDTDLAELLPYFRKEELEIFYNHPDFRKKFKKYTPTITAFIHELRKSKKAHETISIINKYIINLETPTTLEIIYDYLKLDEENRVDFFTIIDKKYNVLSDSEKERRTQIDQEFNRLYDLYTGNKTFHNHSLSSLYDALDYPQREYINKLLMIDHGFDRFVFLCEERMHIHFNALVKSFVNANIDPILFDKEVFMNLNDDKDHYRSLVYTLMLNENHEIAKFIKVLIQNGKYNLIKDMINYNLIDDVVKIDINSDDEAIIQSIENIKNLKKISVYN